MLFVAQLQLQLFSWIFLDDLLCIYTYFYSFKFMFLLLLLDQLTILSRHYHSFTFIADYFCFRTVCATNYI